MKTVETPECDRMVAVAEESPMMLERQTLQEERRDELTAVVDRWG